MIRAICFGAGGHAQVLLEVLSLSDSCEIVVILDSNPALHGTTLRDIPIIGGDEKIRELMASGITHACNGVGTTATATRHQFVYEQGKSLGLKFVPVVHPRATISPSAEIGEGTAVLAHAVVNTAARIGCNVIINSGAIVEHHCTIENHAHIATGAKLAGSVRIGEGVHVGIGAVVREGACIGSNSIVGAGAVVIDDVPDNVVVVGVPARVLRSVK
jgi:sugar O-acyltransferase (sialic acid O-acetyltransferase NeuD family)